MRKNYLIIQAISEKRITQAELVRQAQLSSETRLSRIIHYLVEPTNTEIESLCTLLNLKRSEVTGVVNE